MRIYAAIFFVLALFSSCHSQNPAVKNLNPTDFEKGINQCNVQIVDVRTPEEYKEKHIAGAKNININDPAFDKQIAELDKSKPTYIYCLAGGRSKRAADFAASNGFKEVYNLEFGINSWMGENKTVVSGTGEKVQTSGIGMSFDDYLNHLKASPKLVLVDFNAVWCGPCKTLKPTVTKVVKKNADKVELFDIDVDKNATVANTMNVRAIPLLILYKQGKEVWRSMGLVEEDLIVKSKTVFELVSPSADPVFMIKHFNITVTGKVHGVFFRASTQQMANLLGIKGFVRNETNGDVYLEAEGEEEMLTKLIQWCHHGPANAQVNYVSVNEGEFIGLEGFVVRR